MRGSGKKRAIWIAVVALLVALDQYTKRLAVTRLKGAPSVPLIDGVLEFSYVENFGAAFGVLQNARIFFFILTTIIIIGIVFVLLRMPDETKYRPMRILLLLMLSGAIGNLIDRVRTAYVVDFIYFSLIDFPVFNVADMYVTVSTAVLVFLWIVYYKEEDFAFLKIR